MCELSETVGTHEETTTRYELCEFEGGHAGPKALCELRTEEPVRGADAARVQLRHKL